VVFNGARHLRRAAESVLGQDYRPIEYIVVDGGSTDGTLDILRGLDDRVDYWVSERDRGIYDAMNKGIAQATGEIVGILNSDDWFEPGAVAKSVEALRAGDAGYSYGSAYLVDAAGARIGVARPVPPARFAARVMAETPLPHPTMFVRRPVYARCGGFDARLKLAGDFELIARFHRLGVRGVEIPDALVNFQLGGASRDPLILREMREVALRCGEAPLKAWARYYCARLTMAVKRVLPDRAAGILRGVKDAARRS
jgi:glycosyltransferase involved in cell wall biosynthesis